MEMVAMEVVKLTLKAWVRRSEEERASSCVCRISYVKEFREVKNGRLIR